MNRWTIGGGAWIFLICGVACTSSNDAATNATDASSGAAGSGGSSNAGGSGGDSSVGGSAGTGDSDAAAGSGGGAVANKCAAMIPAGMGTTPLIEDFEDGDVSILKNESRTGGWRFDTDRTAGGIVTPDPLVTAAPDGLNTTKGALHIKADGFTSLWGVSIFAFLNELPDDAAMPWKAYSCGYNASAYDGIYFWAKAVGNSVGKKVMFNVQTRQVIPGDQGGDGTCTTCFDAHFVMITLTGEWAQYSAQWKDLKQGTFGVPKAPFDPSQIGRVAFNVGNLDMPGDIWLDQVGFFKGAPPASPYPVVDAGSVDGASEAGADAAVEVGVDAASDGGTDDGSATGADAAGADGD
jgi:hypothetical protein